MGLDIKPDDLSQAIGIIYDCAVDPKLWPKALESIARLVDGANGLILIVDTIRNEARFHVEWNLGREAMLAYSEKYHKKNLMTEGLSRFNVDEPYNVPAMMDVEDFKRSELYTEYVAPRGWLDSVGVSILRTPSRIATLAFARPAEVGFSGPRELRILGLLSPHVRRAVSIADLIDLRTLAACSFESTLDGLAVPVVLVDDSSVIVHANVAARTLLVQSDPIASDRGVLRAAVPAAAHGLEAAIAQTAQPEARMGKIGIDVPVPYADGRPGFAHVLPIRSGNVRGQLAPRATAAIFFTPSGEPQRPPADEWAAAFGFTPNEMRMLDLLVKGHTVGEAASAMGIAETTARTHVANLMAKAGTKRQAELIQLAARLTPPVRDVKA